MAKSSNRRHDVDVELTLERGQVTTLIVGSVVALGAVFLVGVGVGRRLAPVPERAITGPEPVEEVASAVPALTFHDTLTKKRVEVETAVAPGPKTKPKKVDQKKKRPALDGAALARAQVAVATSVAASSLPVPDKVAGRAKGSENSPQDAARKNDALTFAVQVASSQKEADVDRLAAKVRKAGYAATIVPADIPGRGRWYRLRVGSFDSREDAAMKQAELKVALDLSGLVVSI